MHCSDLPIESCPNFASPGLVPAPPRPCPAPFRLGSSGRLPLYPAPPRPAPPCPAPPHTAPLCLTSVSPSVLLASESGRRGGPDSSYSYLRIWTVHDDSQGSYAPCMTAVLCVIVAYHCIHTAVPPVFAFGSDGGSYSYLRTSSAVRTFSPWHVVSPSAWCLVSPLHSASFRPFPLFLQRFAPRRTILHALTQAAALCTSITLRMNHVLFPTLFTKLHVPHLFSCPLRPAPPRPVWPHPVLCPALPRPNPQKHQE